MTSLDFAWTSSQKPSANQEEEKIWSKILEDVSSESNKVPQGSVIILGENQCGKSSLVARMIGSDRTPCPSVLEYNYLTVHANEDNRQTYQLASAAATFGTQDSMNLPVWILSGDESLGDMLEFSFPKQLSKCVLVLCASFSEPGKILPTLTKWYKLAESQIQKFYNEDAISQARSEQLKSWQEYVEPAGSVYTDTVGNEFRPEFVELEKSVLTETCGTTVIVVLTKADEKPGISAEDMGRLQYQVRKFCLIHGASLIYTSKDEANTQILRKYIAHKVYGVPFTKTAHIVDDASVFIPAGWDSEKKLDLEKEAIPQPENPLPINEEALPSSREKPVECEDEQNFLAQLSKTLAETPVSPKREPAASAQQSNNQRENTSTLANYFGSLIKKE